MTIVSPEYRIKMPYMSVNMKPTDLSFHQFNKNNKNIDNNIFADRLAHIV